jgi:hypothetical protein
VAVAGFDYVDTSGEPLEQTAQHARRVEDFGQVVRNALAGSGRFTVVRMRCPADGCSTSTMAPDDLVNAARQANAALLVFGGIHKMSTLVQWIRVEVLDLRTTQTVLNRTLTFRGDSDEAWRHAADYVGQLLVEPSP